MRVLIAEDEVDICEQYEDIFKENGHDVVITHDGIECISKYSEEHSKQAPNNSHIFDAVILDYKMQHMNGLDAAKEILKINPKQRIIFASAFIEDTLAQSIEHLGLITELIQKPFEIQTLVDMVEDKQIFQELETLNVDVKNLKDLKPTHAQIRDYLNILKKLQEQD